MDTTATMKVDQQHSGHQNEEFESDQWIELPSDISPHASPFQEYNGFNYMHTAQISNDPIYARPPQSAFTAPRPLEPLIMPTWPSEITNPSEGPPPAPPPPLVRPIAPAPSTNTKESDSPSTKTPVSASTKSSTPVSATTPSTARRTLTDDDRRRMCQYHEDHPSVKQTDIGAKFGVERSTVSKVLRQKDKYLFPEDGNRSPVKRGKGKFPDIERAMANWARNHVKQGLPLNDDMIRDKARFFATTVGSQECHAKVNSTAWLEKFKQKNSLPGAKHRKRSDANESDGGDMHLDTRSGSQTPNAISPTSPDEPIVHSTLDKDRSPDGYIDFSYRHSHSESATSLASCLSENTVGSSAFTDGGLRSPTSPFFSPDTSCGPSPCIPSQQPRLPPLASAASRPRRQTFPNIGDGSGFVPSGGSDPMPTGQQRFSPILDSPIVEEPMSDPPLPSTSAPPPTHQQQYEPPTIDSMIHPHHHHHNHQQQRSHHATPTLSRSNSTMAPPPQPSGTGSNNNNLPPYPRPQSSSPPAAPSQDEARRALETVMAFFHHDPHMGPQDFVMIGKLMERLNVETRRDGSSAGGWWTPPPPVPPLPPQHGTSSQQGFEHARGDGTLPIGRKRSMHGMSQ